MLHKLVLEEEEGKVACAEENYIMKHICVNFKLKTSLGHAKKEKKNRITQGRI